MWDDLGRSLLHPRCQGTGPIQVVAAEPFYNEDELPFALAEGGSVVRVIPDPGFRKESLAGSADERLLIVDCPDDDGWLVPDDLIADWLARHVSNEALDDLLLSHPLYEYLTRPDDEGHSRIGARGELVQWAPGLPTIASLYAPEFLPDDEEAPSVNRDRGAYARAVVDLLVQLEARFDLEEIEVGVRMMPAMRGGSRAA